MTTARREPAGQTPSPVPGPDGRAAALVPDVATSTIAVAAPGTGEGFWAGGPSAAVDADGTVLLAYRLRRPVHEGRGYANVVARSPDGEHFEPLVTLHKEDFDAASLERPALIRRPDGGWRLYVSCSVPDSLSWWIDALDADDPRDFHAAARRRVFAGDAQVAYKDPVIHHDGVQWHAWVCRHDIARPAEADRMHTVYATSADGLDWQLHVPALSPRPGAWDQRGTRLTSVLVRDDGAVTGFYDGRASWEQNWHEVTGACTGTFDRLVAVGDGPVATSPYGAGALRYLSVIELADGSHRLYYEATGPTGSNDVMTQLIPRPSV